MYIKNAFNTLFHTKCNFSLFVPLRNLRLCVFALFIHKNVVSNLRKTLIILIILSLGLSSCESEKKYSDFKESDFYEVQGIINYANPTSDPFDSPTEKNI